MLELQATGRLCKDPTHYDKCTKLRIATLDKEPTFFSAVTFGNSHDKILQYIKKGCLVYVRGIAKINTYNDKSEFEVILNKIEVLMFAKRDNENEPVKKDKEFDEELENIKRLYPESRGYLVKRDERGVQVYDSQRNNITDDIKNEEVPF